jgi:hypothetical protein
MDAESSEGGRAALAGLRVCAFVVGGLCVLCVVPYFKSDVSKRSKLRAPKGTKI